MTKDLSGYTKWFANCPAPHRVRSAAAVRCRQPRRGAATGGECSPRGVSQAQSAIKGLTPIHGLTRGEVFVASLPLWSKEWAVESAEPSPANQGESHHAGHKHRKRTGNTVRV